MTYANAYLKSKLSINIISYYTKKYRGNESFIKQPIPRHPENNQITSSLVQSSELLISFSSTKG